MIDLISTGFPSYLRFCSDKRYLFSTPMCRKVCGKSLFHLHQVATDYVELSHVLAQFTCHHVILQDHIE